MLKVRRIQARLRQQRRRIASGWPPELLLKSSHLTTPLFLYPLCRPVVRKHTWIDQDRQHLIVHTTLPALFTCSTERVKLGNCSKLNAHIVTLHCCAYICDTARRRTAAQAQVTMAMLLASETCKRGRLQVSCNTSYTRYNVTYPDRLCVDDSSGLARNLSSAG